MKTYTDIEIFEDDFALTQLREPYWLGKNYQTSKESIFEQKKSKEDRKSFVFTEVLTEMDRFISLEVKEEKEFVEYQQGNRYFETEL